MADSENRPWLRKVLVTLGPLAEWQNKSAGSTVQFASDGTLNGLRVSANIQKTLMGLPSPSTIKVYNREMGSAAVRRLMELAKERSKERAHQADSSSWLGKHQHGDHLQRLYHERPK